MKTRYHSRSRRLCGFILVIVAAVAVAMMAAKARAIGVVDQSQPETDGNGVVLVGSQWAAQTFTPSHNEAVPQVDLLLTRYGSPGDLIVELWKVEGGAPTGGAVAEGRVAADSLDNDPYTYEWVTVPFSVVPTVSSSSRYAIVVRDGGGADFGAGSYYYWLLDGTNQIDGGTAFTSVDGGLSWYGSEAGGDFAFRTYLLSKGCPPASAFQLWNVELMGGQQLAAADRNGDGVACWAAPGGRSIWIDNNVLLAETAPARG